MKGQLWIILFLAIAFSLSAVEVQRVEKIDKYMGLCEITGSDLLAHFSYISETGYDDGFSQKGVVVEFGTPEGKLIRFNKEINRLSLAGFEEDVKIKNRWNRFEVEKDRSKFGGSEGKLKLDKIQKTGSVKYEYKCFQGHACGSYELELELTDCKLDYILNGRKIR